MSENNTKLSIPILPILFLILAAGKVFGHINWSWWWITAPLWGPIGIVVGLFLICAVIIGLIYLGALIFDKISPSTRAASYTQSRIRKKLDKLGIKYPKGY